MDFYIILCSGAAGAAVGLLLGYLWRGYEDSHVWRAEEQERIEQRVSEPTPAKRDTSSAVHCLDQVDALLKRLETI